MLVDAYCGIGTLTLPLAKKVHIATGLEVQQYAVAAEQAILNAQRNRNKQCDIPSRESREIAVPKWAQYQK